ncbi:MAG: hypothetical protein M1530_00075 [Candidatus Marsarchaeota archaeon]|nr:hypothetical protein [Candidatus Marsarchaeota archaeon]
MDDKNNQNKKPVFVTGQSDEKGWMKVEHAERIQKDIGGRLFSAALPAPKKK